MKKILLIITLGLLLTQCTENQRVKSFGGNSTIELERGQALDMVTWKGDNLWLLTKDRSTNELPQTYTFKEESSYGMWEGTYTIKEK